MNRKTTILAFVLTQCFVLAAFAQSSAEFGRTFGGEIQAITKGSRNLSGSLGLMRSMRSDGYEAALGGSIIEDRLWFFASASKLPAMNFETLNVNAQPVDWSDVSASFTAPDTTTMTEIPSSFLSLRSTSILSDKMVVSVSVSRQK